MVFSRFIERFAPRHLRSYGNQAAPDPSGAANLVAPPDAITPYLGLKSRLSQVWINRWTILLLLVLARVLIAIASLDDDMASAKREALSACSGVESMGSAMSSMPHYMSSGLNEITASGVESAVNGLMKMLDLTVKGVEELVVFVFNVMTQTYLCLITLAVRGSVHLALSVIEDATDFLNKTLGDIGSEVSDGVDSFMDELNDILKSVNTVTSAFGGDLDPPKLDFSSTVDKLDNLKLPGSIDDTIDKVNSSIPTFDEVQNATETAVRFPFKEVRKLINETINDFKFDRSVLPVPAKEKMSFCSDDKGISDFFHHLSSILSMAQKIFVGVLLAAAIIACIPMAWHEILRWKAMKERSLLVQKNAHDPMDVVYIVSRPHTSKAGLKVGSWTNPPRRQVLFRWVVAYATSTPALFVLCLGFAGLFSCACQLILLRAVQKEVPKLTAQVSEFSEKVVTSLNDTSEQWASSANGVINDVDDDINNKVLSWVNTTTTSVNDTLNIFVNETMEVLDGAFGGTPLHDPIKGVLDCLILLKIEAVQHGLTWVSEHAHVSFPHVPKDAFSLGAAASIGSDNDTRAESFLANPGDETSDAISGAVLRVVHALEKAIRTEAIISTCIVAIWIIILLCAVLRALMLAWRCDKVRGEGGVDGVYHPPDLPSNSRGAGGSGMAGFHDVPLTSVGAVPRYSTTPHVRGGSNGLSDVDEHYQAQKLGFAGQRDYETAVNKEGVYSPGRKSSYGEVEYGSDVKR